MNKGKILKISENYVKDNFIKESTGHDWWHIKRVHDLAMKINETEHQNEFVIKMIALFHDVFDETFSEGNVVENLKIPNTDLIIANFSLSFCKKNYFKSMWENIVESININGYFVGTIFGIKDSWNKECRDMSFFTREEAEKLFKQFKIIRFEEIENDKPTALGEEKHWHFYSIIAQKEYNNE